MADLSFRAEGEGKPILIIHGWTMAGYVEAHDFEPIFAQRTGYKRIYVDLPGHGSTPSDDVHDLDEMFERLSRFIEKNILPAEFLVIGSSCGGAFARAVAFRFASSVLGLVLRFPLIEADDSKRDLDAFKPIIANQAVLDALPHTEKEQLGSIAVQTPEHIAALSNKCKALFLPASGSADCKVLDPIRNDPARYRLTASMHSPTEPFERATLILTGRQDGVVGYRDGWKLLPAYPRATFVAIDRAGHALPVDDVPLFTTLVQDWLDRVREMEVYVPQL